MESMMDWVGIALRWPSLVKWKLVYLHSSKTTK